MHPDLANFIDSILVHDEYLLGGVHHSELNDLTTWLQVGTEWSRIFGRRIHDVLSVMEPCLRQSVFFTLIPHEALEGSFTGSFDTAINKHLVQLGLTLTEEQKVKIRTIIVNLRALSGLDSKAARRKSSGIAELKAQHDLYEKISNRQKKRCYFCGFKFDSMGVGETLDHIAPKHLGDDPSDGSNWVIACPECNAGKGDAFSWATNEYSFDYIQRKDIEVGINQVTRHHRWIALARDKKCLYCELQPKDIQLHIHKIISTGLPIPSNLKTVCENCKNANSIMVLAIRP